MPPLSYQPWGGLRPPVLPLRAGFATSKPRCRALRPGPRGSVRRPPPPKPISRRPESSSRLQPEPGQRQEEPSNTQESSTEAQEPKQSSVDTVSSALRDQDSQANNLLSPVHIPEDPNGVLNERHPATNILSNSAIVVTRQLELMNVMLGFEQANKYVIMDPKGGHIGYMAERELGMGNMMARQMFSTHRSFTTHVFDRHGKEVLRFHRPFSWISSRIGIYDPVEETNSSPSSLTAVANVNPGSLTAEVNPDTAQISRLALGDMRIIGEAQQQWAPLRRKYNLFVHRHSQDSGATSGAPKYSPADQPLSNSQQLDLTPYNGEGRFNQFAHVNEKFLSWDFSLLSNDGGLIGSVNRNFAGFGREIFTDTGVYALRMDSVGLAQEPTHLTSQSGQQSVGFQNPNDAGMTLDQRAVMLATAVSIDFDYFSRKSGSGGMGFMPLWLPGMGGGGAAAEGAEAEAGAGTVEGSGGAAGGIAKRDSGGWTEGAVTGAGTMAGYEAMQRGTGRGGDDSSPQAGQQDANQPGYGQDQQQQPGQVGQNEDVWGNNDDPWGGGRGPGGGDSGGDGGDGGGDSGDFDWF